MRSSIVEVGGWPMTPQDQVPPQDNYEAFLERLNDATTRLTTRLRSVDKALTAVSSLVEKYQSASLKWEQRRARVSEELDHHAGGPETYAVLGELHDTAVKMVTLHHAQTLRIKEQVHFLQGQCNAIRQSLVELRASSAALNASRRLSKDRHNLNRALYELAGARGAAESTPDPGLLNDLRQAREAVVLAEALMEVKGPR
ncbi:hypothetical protein [Paenarthrobacter aurescens]|uniref:hypothetical protein n=1 Tax=Paenarthrobacter aurescens TaxID=43663 RepID=UPI0021C0FBE0|nr:hypothetical protein [Paenarthrobacter aurescens]MCT9869826.1 hypothetical protein [Paenarthrobacter aurescens]